MKKIAALILIILLNISIVSGNIVEIDKTSENSFSLWNWLKSFFTGEDKITGACC